VTAGHNGDEVLFGQPDKNAVDVMVRPQISDTRGHVKCNLSAKRTSFASLTYLSGVLSSAYLLVLTIA
jgi:hypothetical protein